MILCFLSLRLLLPVDDMVEQAERPSEPARRATLPLSRPPASPITAASAHLQPRPPAPAAVAAVPLATHRRRRRPPAARCVHNPHRRGRLKPIVTSPTLHRLSPSSPHRLPDHGSRHGSRHRPRRQRIALSNHRRRDRPTLEAAPSSATSIPSPDPPRRASGTPSTTSPATPPSPHGVLRSPTIIATPTRC